jgi:hypothetical protein
METVEQNVNPVETPAEVEPKEAPVEQDKPTLTASQQLDNSIKIATMQQVALNQLVQLGIRNYIGEMCRPKLSGAERVAVAKSLERAILAGLDYGVDVAKVNLDQKGKFAKVENSFAAHIARCKENGMILTAYNFERVEKDKEDGTYVKPSEPEVVEEVKNKLGLTEEQIEALETMTPKEKKIYLKTKGDTHVENKEANEEINKNKTNEEGLLNV